MSFEEHSAGKTTAVVEVQVGSVGQRKNVQNATICMELESVSSHRSDDTKQDETISAVINCALLVMKLRKSIAVQYGKKVVELLHRYKFNIEAISDSLKNVRTCSELVQGRFIRILEKQNL